VALLVLGAEKLYVAAHDDETLEDFQARTGLEFEWL